MTSDVTIIIPTYNRVDYLSLTIQSALDQTWPEVQVLVMGDASTDGTPALMQSYADNPRVKYIRHATNVGMAPNWRSGVAEVKTAFYCLLNDDDLLERTFVEKLVRPLLKDDDLILSFCDHHVIDEKGRSRERMANQLSKHHGRSGLKEGLVEDFGAAVTEDRSLHISCTLFRASMAPEDFIDERSGGFACGWLFYECYRTGHRAWYVKEKLANYRVHSGNMLGSARWEDYLAKGQIHWCRRMLSDHLPEPLGSRVRKQVANIFSSYAIGWLRAGRRKEAGELFQEALTLQKNPKSFAGKLLCKTGPLGTGIARLAWRLLHRSGAHTLQLFLWPLPIGDNL